MNSTKMDIYKLLLDFEKGFISRANAINKAKVLLESNIDISDKSLLESIVQNSLINNRDYLEIEQNRSNYYNYLAELQQRIDNQTELSELKLYLDDEILDRQYIYSEIRNKEYINKETFEQDFKKDFEFILKEYLNDGLSEFYLSDLIYRLAFKNNRTSIDPIIFKTPGIYYLITQIDELDYLSDHGKKVEDAIHLEEIIQNYLDKN